MDETCILSPTVNKTLNKALFDTAVGRRVDLRVREGDLRASGDQSGRVNLEVNLRSILVN